MYNKPLEYLKSYNPEDVVNKADVILRKKFYYVLSGGLILANPYKLHIIKETDVLDIEEEKPENVPVIFAPTHGFKDDLINTMISINTHAYTLFGSLDQFYRTVDGYLANLMGVVIVDRDDYLSREASIPKMQRVISFGTNIVILPEGAWNLTDAEIVMKLFSGIYRLSKLTGSWVSPVATHIEGKSCYSIVGKSYNITKMTDIRIREILALMGKNLSKASDLLVYNDEESIDIKENINKLIKLSKTSNSENKDLEASINIINLISNDATKTKLIVDNQRENFINCKKELEEIKLDSTVYDIRISIMGRISNLLKVVINAEENVAMSELRDKMASLKFKLMEDYSSFSRSELELPGKTLREQWEDTKRKLKSQPEYYIDEKEINYPYRDNNIYSEEEVFGQIDSVNITPNNSYVLSKTLNSSIDLAK